LPGKPSRPKGRELFAAEMKTARARDREEAAVPIGTSSSGTASPGSPLQQADGLPQARLQDGNIGCVLKEGDRRRIGQEAVSILSQGNPVAAANMLGEKLWGMTRNEQDEMIRQLAERDPVKGAAVLGAAGAAQGIRGEVSAENRSLIAEALGGAYHRGILSRGDLGRLLSPAVRDEATGNAEPQRMARLIALSGSDKLQADAAAVALETAAGAAHTRDQAAFSAAAAVAASGSAAATKGLLDRLSNDGELDGFLFAIRPESLSARRLDASALGTLAQAANGIRPPTSSTDGYFDKAVACVDGEPQAKQGLAKYFQDNLARTTERLVRSDDQSAQRTMAQFAGNVLFSEPFAGQDELRKDFARHIGDRVAELRDAPDSLPGAAHKARQLGFLIGGAEVGFQRALDRVRDKNAAREAMVDLLFNVAGPIGLAQLPDLKLGSLDLKKTMIGQLKEQAFQFVRENEPRASEMTAPLYYLARTIAPDYRDEMVWYRGNFHEDERQEYVN
jgi:hypothetical protein